MPTEIKNLLETIAAFLKSMIDAIKQAFESVMPKED